MNSKLSREVGAAVDKNRLTVYVGAVVREQERHHGRDVLGRAEARRPHRRKHLLAVLLVQNSQGGSSQRDSGCHDVAAYPVLAADSGSVSVEPDEPTLCRLIRYTL